MRVAVVGSGIAGLTTALRLREKGATVTVYTREPPQRTTSAVAGAVWFPYRVQPNERTGPWGAVGYERFARLAEGGEAPVTIAELTMLHAEPLAAEPWWVDSVPGAAVRAAGDEELPDGYVAGHVVRVPCIQAPRYLDWLAMRLAELGGTVEQRELSSLAEPEADAVVNCAGVGARLLTQDDDLRPVRGQVAYVRPLDPPLRFLLDEAGPNALAYVLPRPDVVVLGGTAEEGDFELEPRPETTRDIIERTRRLEPRLAEAEYVGAAVGLRAGRSEVRLERDTLPDGRPLIHNYGHGGSGFTLSWGCAEEAAQLALDRR